MNTRRILIHFLLTFMAVSISSAKSMNILFIGADDLRTQLGCYGHEQMITPNIDRLAEEGVLFQRAYVQQAVCAASRASFLTGCRPDTTGVDYPYSEYFMGEFRSTRPTMSEYFHQQGYYARTFGKVHHGFEDHHLSEPHYLPTWNVHYVAPDNIALGKKHESGRSQETPVFEFYDAPDVAYKDGMITAEAIDTIRRADQQNKPFFLSVGYFKPHLPWVAPKRYWDLYEGIDVGLAQVPSLPEGAPEYATSHYSLENYAGENDSGGRHLSEARARKLRRAYFACVSFIDAQVGIVLGELERLGIRDNTIVVFWSDHGWHLGDQGAWGKVTNYEWATRAPLIVSVPGMKAAGAHTNALIEYVDLYPTLADLAGLTIPEFLEGTSFLPVLENPEAKWKNAAFSQYPRGEMLEGYAIRTHEFRYVEWWAKDGLEKTEIRARELYDHRVDGSESVNLVNLPENVEVVRMLSAQLAAGWKAALPPGVTNLSENPPAPLPIAFGPEKEAKSARQANGR
jgi:iduronate 2-sulfatase